ncbi:MAG: MotA/TolQ/ExbB proton channel family protein [Kiritimatiellia bacterium]
MKKWLTGFTVAAVLAMMGAAIPESAIAQDEAGGDAVVAAAAPAEDAGKMQLDKDVAAGDAAAKTSTSPGFMDIVNSSGTMGTFLWLALLIALFAGIYFIVDGIILIRVNRVMPQTLLAKVREAMSQGDVALALESCKNEPCPMANILTAGFSHVEEGFDVIQEAIGISADFESEQMMQRIQYLTLVAAISPMLGLLGTVQGMIYAFFNLAIMGSGAAQTGTLALNIGQALYTTAAGLCITIPVMSVYHILRNKANKIILRMQAHTMELVKDLRNVEVVSE